MYNESFKLIQEELATISKHPKYSTMIACIAQWQDNLPTAWDLMAKEIGEQNKNKVLELFIIPVLKKKVNAGNKLKMYSTYISSEEYNNIQPAKQTSAKPQISQPKQSESQKMNNLIMDL